MIRAQTILLSFIIFSFGLTPAIAQTEATTEPVQESTTTAVEPTPTQTPSARAENERTITLQARTQARITNLAANISNRLEAYINRLQNIATRFASRLDKLEASGIDVTTARASLARAQAALDAANTEMIDIDNRVAMVTSSSEPRAAWRDVQRSYLQTRDHIRTAFNELRTVMIDVRAALTNPTPTPDATVATSTNEQ